MDDHISQQCTQSRPNAQKEYLLIRSAFLWQKDGQQVMVIILLKIILPLNWM